MIKKSDIFVLRSKECNKYNNIGAFRAKKPFNLSEIDELWAELEYLPGKFSDYLIDNGYIEKIEIKYVTLR